MKSITTKNEREIIMDKIQSDELFNLVTYYVSDCCGDYVSDDSQICPSCGEHIGEIIKEEYPVNLS